MDRNKSIKIIISLLYILIILIVLLSIQLVRIDSDNISSLSNPHEEQSYSERYRGFNLISDENNFSRIEYLLDRLDVTQSDYPNLLEIHYVTNGKHCNGDYYYNQEYIYVYSCDKGFNLRNYHISKEDSELFTLAHEFGHYAFHNYFDYELQQNLADDYAYSLSKVGVRIR